VEVCASTRSWVSVEVAASLVLVMSMPVSASEKVGVGLRVDLLECGVFLVLIDWLSGHEFRSDVDIGKLLDNTGCFGVVVGEEAWKLLLVQAEGKNKEDLLLWRCPSDRFLCVSTTVR